MYHQCHAVQPSLTILIIHFSVLCNCKFHWLFQCSCVVWWELGTKKTHRCRLYWSTQQNIFGNVLVAREGGTPKSDFCLRVEDENNHSCLLKVFYCCVLVCIKHNIMESGTIVFTSHVLSSNKEQEGAKYVNMTFPFSSNWSISRCQNQCVTGSFLALCDVCLQVTSHMFDVIASHHFLKSLPNIITCALSIIVQFLADIFVLVT